MKVSVHYQYQKLLLSGDIELNPSPRLPPKVVLEQSRRLQLRPFDVGGDGDCSFRAVSHQFYGDPKHHVRESIVINEHNKCADTCALSVPIFYEITYM